MSKQGNNKTHKVRVFSQWLYFACLTVVIFLLLLGFVSTLGLTTKTQTQLHEFGIGVYKYPLIEKYLVVSSHDSPLSPQGLHEEHLLALNDCNVKSFESVRTLIECAKIDNTNTLNISTLQSNKETNYTAIKDVDKRFSLNTLYLAIDASLSIVSLLLSLLLFAKARRFLSGYLLSLVLLLNAGESLFFYTGSIAFGAVQIETLRIGLACLIGPFAMYFFPQAFNKDYWKKPLYILLCICVALMLASYNFLAFNLFFMSVSFTLLVIVLHFVIKYRAELNTRERKQVKSMMLSVGIGLILYLLLITFGGAYGFLLGRYTIGLCVGIGVFIALMRYGLWQVESIISKSAALSLLSIVAFSLWAGLDQGLQALLNQTIGLSNKTFTAFLAAVISSLFVVPVYNFVSKSCDAFFNKELHQLKRLLSKEILVFAETQTLEAFIEQLGKRILELTGAHKIYLEFMDNKRLQEPIRFEGKSNKIAENDPYIKEEDFDFQLDGILFVKLRLTFIDRRINKEIKHELEEGTDEMARALASCSRWNYLETMGRQT